MIRSAPRRAWLAPALGLLLLAWPGSALAFEAAHFGTPGAAVVGFAVAEDGAVHALTVQGRSLRVEISGGVVGFRDVGAQAVVAEALAGALPDGVVETGPGEVAAAWLIDPTTRYGHGVLGDAIEAGGLGVRFRDGSSAELRLGPDQVFEDRRARIVDSDGDGPDELLVVRSELSRGRRWRSTRRRAEPSGCARPRGRSDGRIAG